MGPVVVVVVVVVVGVLVFVFGLDPERALPEGLGKLPLTLDDLQTLDLSAGKSTHLISPAGQVLTSGAVRRGFVPVPVRVCVCVRHLSLSSRGFDARQTLDDQASND